MGKNRKRERNRKREGVNYPDFLSTAQINWPKMFVNLLRSLTREWQSLLSSCLSSYPAHTWKQLDAYLGNTNNYLQFQAGQLCSPHPFLCPCCHLSPGLHGVGSSQSSISAVSSHTPGPPCSPPMYSAKPDSIHVRLPYWFKDHTDHNQVFLC